MGERIWQHEDVSLPPGAGRIPICCGRPRAALHGQAVDELLALLGGVQASCLLRCAGAMRVLTSRRVRRRLVQDCPVVYHPVRRPPNVVRLPVSLLQLRCGCVPWHASDRPAKQEISWLVRQTIYTLEMADIGRAFMSHAITICCDYLTS